MIKFRSKHVCTPSARKFRPHKEKDKVKVVAVERLPIDHIPVVEEKKKRKPIDPAKYAASDKIPQSSRTVHGTEIPRCTITCGNNPVGMHIYNPKITSNGGRKIDRTAHERKIQPHHKKTN
jgi:hypothetical protein